MFEPNEVFKIISQGGAPAIFLLLLFISLIFTGVLRLRREVEGMEKLNGDLLSRIDRQQALFERSLDLLERQLSPLTNERRVGESASRWTSDK